MDWLKEHGKSTEWLRLRLLEEFDTYALTKDPSLQKLMESRGGIPYERQVYSLLISYGKVPAQSLHIDMVNPLYQGVLLLTPSPPTHVYPVQNVLNMNVEKLEVEDFVNLLCERSPSPVSTDARNDLVKAILDDTGARSLVERFGWLFASAKDKLIASKQVTDQLPGKGSPFCGYVGFPGSVIHRGPPCDRFRMALFVSLGQASDKPYEDDGQHTAPSLHAALSNLIYDKMKNPEAQWAFLQVGTQLTAEDAAGATDFMQYGDEGAVSTCNPAEVSVGLVLATAQARFQQKLRLHAESLQRKMRSRKRSRSAEEAFVNELQSIIDNYIN
jgi:hypothetical protein